MKGRTLRTTLVLCGCLTLAGASYAQKKADVNDATARLRALFKEEWETTLRENPTFASALGDRRYNDVFVLDARASAHRHRRRR